MLMFTTAPDGNQLEEFMKGDSSFPILVNGIQRGIDEGYFKEHPAGIMAMSMIFWSGVHGLAMLEHTQLKGSDIDFDAIGEMVGQNMFLGLTMPIQPPPSPE